MEIDLSQVEIGSPQGCSFHLKNVAEQLGMTPTETPTGPYRYFLGNFSSSLAPRLFLQGAEVAVVHWIGTDVVEAQQGGAFYRHPDLIHWADSPNLVDELRPFGIEAKWHVHRPTNYLEEPLPPGGDAIAVYVPESRTGFFRLGMIERVQRKMRGREFVYLPRKDWSDIRDVFRNCSHYLRLVAHDGMSHLAMEFAMAGRVVVTNQDRPFQLKVDEEDVDEIVEALTNGQPDPDAPAYYRDLTDPRHIREEMARLIKEHEHE